MGWKQAKSITAELEASKARLRSMSGKRRSTESSLTLNQAKINFLKASDRLEKTGAKIVANTSVGQLETWTRQQPWQATSTAVAAGLLAGRMHRGDVLFLNSIIQLLAAVSEREN